ncbi:MAG: 4-diphosphocytidyl-2-C-methyl-D-erythritol kinase [Actinomycetota bacterium]
MVLVAPAKLTLHLRVVGVRADGYHLIDADMATLALHDVLTIDPTGDGVQIVGPFADGVPASNDNLVARALQLARRTASVIIDKQIPSGGGLGGGSADAAAVLRWAGYTDLVGASRLGADIPFCMVGGRARVSGIGEVVEARPKQAFNVTLIVPPLKVATPAVYSAWDSLSPAEQRGELNDLEAAALVVEPQLDRWRDRIREAAGVAPTLAGSGATWFVLGDHDIAAALPEATVLRTTNG